MPSRPAARLAPCSKLSRTLRAGVAGAARAASWTAFCARRSAGGRSGRRDGSLAVEQRDGPKKDREERKIAKFSLDFGSPIQGYDPAARVELIEPSWHWHESPGFGIF